MRSSEHKIAREPYRRLQEVGDINAQRTAQIQRLHVDGGWSGLQRATLL